MAFDPYSELLGLPPSQRPPSPEQLLGVQPGESDEPTILEAAARQNNRLKGYVLGEWADVASGLQREVSQAVVELTNRAGAKAATPPLGTAPIPSAVDEVEILIAPLADFSARRPRHRPESETPPPAKEPAPPDNASREDTLSVEDLRSSAHPLANLERAAAMTGEPANTPSAMVQLAGAPSHAAMSRRRRRRLAEDARGPIGWIVRFDDALRTLGGEDNNILHIFLRVLCVTVLGGLVVAVVLSLSRLQGPEVAAKPSASSPSQKAEQSRPTKPPAETERPAALPSRERPLSESEMAYQYWSARWGVDEGFQWSWVIIPAAGVIAFLLGVGYLLRGN
jgi:hypothetical protein